MQVKHFLYNTFIIQSGDKKIAIDPGALFLYFFRLTSLIPKTEWQDITHIFVTHGDPDHYYHMDRVAEVSNARVICNQTMVKKINGEALLLGPRAKGLKFTTPVKHLQTIAVDETVGLDGMSITGLKATHGPLTLKIGPISKTETPGPDERVGWGAMGFMIRLNGKTIVNLGDTLLELEAWKSIKKPDVLMLPIGGRDAHNTMDEKEAIEAVRQIQPKRVIPCHYNLPALFSKNYCPADVAWFKSELEKMNIGCEVMQNGSVIDL